MYKLDELVRPYVHKILVVIEPLLIDKDYYARVEGNILFLIFPNNWWYLWFDEFFKPWVFNRLQFTENYNFKYTK